jgi:hemoglobin
LHAIVVYRSAAIMRVPSIAAAALLIAAVCGAGTPAESPLYARLGGEPKMTLVVGELIDHSASDPRTRRSFDGVDIPRVKKLLVEQICELTGGGCKYTGDSMHDVHAGLGIDQSEFYGLVEVLRESMRKHGIGLRERNELLAILAPMKRDVVEK